MFQKSVAYRKHGSWYFFDHGSCESAQNWYMGRKGLFIGTIAKAKARIRVKTLFDPCLWNTLPRNH